VPARRIPPGTPPDTLTAADRQLVIDVALEDRGAGVLARAILEQPSRQAAIAYVRAVLGRGVTSGWTSAGEAYAAQGLGQRIGLAVTVGDRSGMIRWSEIADAVRLRQLALPFP
jgi:hypothetical protein